MQKLTAGNLYGYIHCSVIVYIAITNPNLIKVETLKSSYLAKITLLLLHFLLLSQKIIIIPIVFTYFDILGWDRMIHIYTHIHRKFRMSTKFENVYNYSRKINHVSNYLYIAYKNLGIYNSISAKLSQNILTIYWIYIISTISNPNIVTYTYKNCNRKT